MTKALCDGANMQRVDARKFTSVHKGLVHNFEVNDTIEAFSQEVFVVW